MTLTVMITSGTVKLLIVSVIITTQAARMTTKAPKIRLKCQKGLFLLFSEPLATKVQPCVDALLP